MESKILAQLAMLGVLKTMDAWQTYNYRFYREICSQMADCIVHGEIPIIAGCDYTEEILPIQ